MIDQTLKESLLVGLVAGALAFTMYVFLVNYNNEFKNIKKKAKRIAVTFFIIGIVIHNIVSYLGIEDWRCDKQCMAKVRNFITI